MSNTIQSAPLPVAKAAQAMLLNQPAAPDSPSTASQENPKKNGNQFVKPSLNREIYLFNMLIINSLNR
jgi:hypothetical protein